MRYYLGPFFEPFLGWDVTTLTQKRFHKRIIHLKVPFTFDFHLSINIGTLNTNLAFFDPILGLWRHHSSQNCNILRKWSQKQNYSLQSSIRSWFRSFYYSQYMIYNFGIFFTQFGYNDVTKEVHNSEFWKINSRIGFDQLELD